MQFHTQAGKITTNLKVRIYFTLPEFTVTKILACDCHVNDSSKGIYDMILGRDVLTALGLYLKFSNYIIEGYYGYFKGSLAPMVDLGTYEFKYLETGKLHLKNCS